MSHTFQLAGVAGRQAVAALLLLFAAAAFIHDGFVPSAVRAADGVTCSLPRGDFVSVETDTAESGGDAGTDAAAAVEVQEKERAYPSLPGAVREIPEWMNRKAPFDVAKRFRPIPDEENAAPLYLEVLFEFVPNEMEKCVSPEENATRGPDLRARAMQTGRLMVNPQAATPAERRLDVLKYRDAFDKLAEAQKRPRCMFETGLDEGSSFPHAQSSRQAIRLLDWRVEMWVDEGNLGAALDDVTMGLRLSRDLRPRGMIIPQLVSVALDSVIVTNMIPRILAAPDLKTADCDRLLEILARHDADAIDLLNEAFRVEYLLARDLVHRVELLGRMTEDERDAEIEALNRYFQPLIEGKLPHIDQMEKVLERQAEAAEDLRIAASLVELPRAQLFEAARRNRTRLDAAKCLVALARWKIEHPDMPPPDLAAVCKAAGMKSVPPDPYSSSDEPLRGIILDGEFVIYSVAGDGEDNEALVDWQWGKFVGDWIFRLKAQ